MLKPSVHAERWTCRGFGPYDTEENLALGPSPVAAREIILKSKLDPHPPILEHTQEIIHALENATVFHHLWNEMQWRKID